MSRVWQPRRLRRMEAAYSPAYSSLALPHPRTAVAARGFFAVIASSASEEKRPESCGGGGGAGRAAAKHAVRRTWPDVRAGANVGASASHALTCYKRLRSNVIGPPPYSNSPLLSVIAFACKAEGFVWRFLCLFVSDLLECVSNNLGHQCSAHIGMER